MQGQLPDLQVMAVPQTTDGEGLSGRELLARKLHSPSVWSKQMAPCRGLWSGKSTEDRSYIYVREANDARVSIAGVVDNENGTMTATYASGSPGQCEYHVDREEADLPEKQGKSRGRPTVRSPSQLMISRTRTLVVDAFPVCGTKEDMESTLWGPGSQVS